VVTKVVGDQPEVQIKLTRLPLVTSAAPGDQAAQWRCGTASAGASSAALSRHSVCAGGTREPSPSLTVRQRRPGRGDRDRRRRTAGCDGATVAPPP
jgi:hypothetical protein